MSGKGTSLGRTPRGKSSERAPKPFRPSLEEVNRRLKVTNECLETEIHAMVKCCEDQSALFVKREFQAEELKEEISDLQEKITVLEKERAEEKVDVADSLKSLKDDHKGELRQQKKKFETTIKGLEENLILVRQQKNHYVRGWKNGH